jgi:hypothetical protein
LFLSFTFSAQKASDCLDLKELDEYILKSMEEWRIPGLSIASNTKAFTASAIAVLVDEGKLNWDKFVKKTFFDPLGMSETTTKIRGLESVKNVAQPHYVGDESEKTITIPYINWDNIGPDGKIEEMKIDIPNPDFYFTELEFKKKN